VGTYSLVTTNVEDTSSCLRRRQGFRRRDTNIPGREENLSARELVGE
jgi:hypothetical protein